MLSSSRNSQKAKWQKHQVWTSFLILSFTNPEILAKPSDFYDSVSYLLTKASNLYNTGSSWGRNPQMGLAHISFPFSYQDLPKTLLLLAARTTAVFTTPFLPPSFLKNKKKKKKKHPRRKQVPRSHRTLRVYTMPPLEGFLSLFQLL